MLILVLIIFLFVVGKSGAVMRDAKRHYWLW